jgi:hypothetical protein
VGENTPIWCDVVDLGCGSVFPITAVPVEEGLHVFAVDAAPSFVAAFKRNLHGEHRLIQRLAEILEPDGRPLFTAPANAANASAPYRRTRRLLSQSRESQPPVRACASSCQNRSSEADVPASR